MPLTELTKITGPGIKTDTNFVGNNAHFTGITTTDGSFNVGVTTIHSNLAEIHNVVSTGVITATKFIGDGSDLTSLPAGLGTALHPAVNTPLNSIFYVNDTLHVTQNSVVTLPNTSSNAYTQYANIQVEDSIEITIDDDVNFIPDVLSLFP
jgi:hypothetical protein|tara:strand:- start:27 stop:479 length:453 start_codon:yes stop_codon:yes gene_type:complete